MKKKGDPPSHIRDDESPLLLEASVKQMPGGYYLTTNLATCVLPSLLTSTV